MNRRFFVKYAGAAVGLLLLPLRAFGSRPESAFESESTGDALEKLFGSADLTETDRIKIKAPEIAENGAVVPITVNFDIENAESVSIIAENNPAPLAASFDLTPNSAGLVSTRIKMGKTSPIHAVIKAGDTIYHASREVKVTIGGCGG
ncbi:thiosulfate oxidation carrier protein SoxY [Thioalkalivibrio sp. HK1]|uniref:thiosulfate oxidation carrier protein SoxY n=1 Tax=Thioalkalivibrio sp. HK1 TaxID=1469245 RepID=UPI000470F18F|nr:thiosulfate oxidation carrier protein SoxY [Thioalkalivibrio sp. HK1]